jgi:hypothetical protein
MIGILKGWVMISLSLSSGWTASGEHRDGGRWVAVALGKGDGVIVSVGTSVSVGGILVDVGEKGVGDGVGAVEQEALANKITNNKRGLPRRQSARAAARNDINLSDV